MCAIFTGALHNHESFLTLVLANECGEKPRQLRLLAKVDFPPAPFPVRRLWTGCTRLKTRVLTKPYFSLTEKMEGVQQDRSLTTS
jgi:hypothetical protein